MGGDLHLGLDFPLPAEVRVGAGTALFVAGWCFSSHAEVRSLALVVDGEVQPLADHGMPRADVFGAHRGAQHSFRSGFWGVARIEPRTCSTRHELLLRAELDGGGTAEAALAYVADADPPAEPAEVSAPERGAGPLVAICMATYDPPPELLRRQVESIRAQTHRNWICVISDDSSRPAFFEAIAEVVGDDSRFVISRSPRRRGFYGNFERALSLAPAAAEFVCMADQDDRWDADKLATLLAEMGDAQLVYSDARLVDRQGRRIADTYWGERRNNHSSLYSLLMANSITGAASLFRREVVEHALPFPPRQFAHFHDHWVGLTALALGEVAFVERPLYDYVQHRGAVLGHAAANRMPTLRQRLGGARRTLRERVRLWRLTYFVDCCRIMQYATVLEMRCGDRMTAAKGRAVRSFLRSDRSLAGLGWLGLRAARELVGRPETLGAELGLFFAFLWRNLLVASTLGLDRPRRHLRLDALPPTTLIQTPGRTGPGNPAVRRVAEKIAPLALAPRDDAPPRINVLIPTIDLDHFFAGYIAKFNLARRLAERGHRVRIVTVDPVPPLPSSWRRMIESYSGLGGLLDRVEVSFGRESQDLEVSRSDRFVASAWWTAHVAHDAVRELGGERFLYLIQEHEPFTFPMGTWAALAGQSYRFPHCALFSSELLRGWFRLSRLGVYEDGANAGDASSAAFQNAITPVEPPDAPDLAGRSPRRLLFYARPEPHAARNMFELGVLALARALKEGAFAEGWELDGIGTVEGRRRLALGAGRTLEVLPRAAQADYARLLREHDVGLALMYTPHPSLVPIEMAAAGLLTVTNSFENKTAEAMAAISPSIVVAEPTVDAVARGLRQAAAMVDDVERRVRGSSVSWSRDWDSSFDDRVMERVEGFLDG